MKYFIGDYDSNANVVPSQRKMIYSWEKKIYGKGERLFLNTE